MFKLTNRYRLARKFRQLLKRTPNDDVVAKAIEGLLRKPQPPNASIGVSFFSPKRGGFQKSGKVKGSEYLPVFCDYLRDRGVATYLVTSEVALQNAIGRTNRSVVVCIYGEDRHVPGGTDLFALLDRANLVFNHPKSGAIIANKLQTNAALAAAGCSVPRLAAILKDEDLVFSNEVSNTAATTYTATKGTGLDEGRYNTEFVDTAREYHGRQYYSMMRLMCINERITHYSLRLRDVSENDAGVHLKNTPLDSDLINSLSNTILTEAEEQFEDIARKVYKCFGPGFYSHDTLVDARTGRAYICETGYKFNNNGYDNHMKPVAHQLIAIRGYETAANVARASAPIFLNLVEDALRDKSPVDLRATPRV